MAKTHPTPVDAYIAAQPKASHATLLQVRAAIRKALPLAEESISYQIPTYKLNGTAVLYFAGWKKHYSLYPVTEAITTKFQTELASYEVQKGTVRFPLSEAVPVKLIERIAKLRAQETGDRAPAKLKRVAKAKPQTKTRASKAKPKAPSKAKRAR